MILLKEFNESHAVAYSLDEAANTNSSGKKDLYITGIFAEAELKNRNGRIYPLPIMESAVNKYIAEKVSKRLAISELSHPENRPNVKPELASHLITELRMDGPTVYGKARVLDTPQGNILRGLLEGGVQMGVSTRALGSVKESNGTNIVQDDFQLFAIDAVSDPSSINAWIDSINESKEWLVTDDGQILEKYQKIVKTQKIDESKALALFTKFLSDIVVR
jgi:hypothetical protein